MALIGKQEKRDRRRMRIRKRVTGTAQRPRLCVAKSLKHIYLQIIDDEAGRTIAAATSNTGANRESGRKSFANITSGTALGREVAEKAKAAGIDSVVFDRSGYPYHGIVKAVAEAAREAGLKF